MITKDPVHVPMTVHDMGNAAPAWHIIVITMRVFQGASFSKEAEATYDRIIKNLATDHGII